jgi:hypothetical protein
VRCSTSAMGAGTIIGRGIGSPNDNAAAAGLPIP